MTGYIKAYRSLLENPLVCRDTETFAVWNYLLLSVNHAEQKVLFGGKSITMLPGQMITGRKKIADFWKISESKVERILNLLENEQQIEQQKSNKNRLITVLNWQKYQNSEQQIEQQVNNNRTTSEQQVNTNKNIKNDNNINNYTTRTRVKKKYGEFQNVFLTDAEIEKLKKQLPNFDKNLETFSKKLEKKGYKYKSHYLAMLDWFKTDEPERDDKPSYDIEKIKKRVNNFE